MSVPAAGADQRIAVYGALDYASGQVLWRTAAHKDGVGFAAFLEQIGQTWPEEDLVLVLDNVSYHRSEAMRTWWTEQDGRGLPFWLPAYAPTSICSSACGTSSSRSSPAIAFGPIRRACVRQRSRGWTRPKLISMSPNAQRFAWSTSFVNPLSAGHGVHRTDSLSRADPGRGPPLRRLRRHRRRFIRDVFATANRTRCPGAAADPIAVRSMRATVSETVDYQIPLSRGAFLTAGSSGVSAG